MDWKTNIRKMNRSKNYITKKIFIYIYIHGREEEKHNGQTESVKKCVCWNRPVSVLSERTLAECTLCGNPVVGERGGGGFAVSTTADVLAARSAQPAGVLSCSQFTTETPAAVSSIERHTGPNRTK